MRDVIICIRRHSIVGIATFYSLDGAGFELRWGGDFPHPSRPALGPTSCTNVTEYFPGIKLPGRGFAHPPPPGAQVKERVELILHFPSLIV